MKVTHPDQAFEAAVRDVAGSGRWAPWQVFADFCEMAALSLSNVVQKAPEREARYEAVRARYAADVRPKFAQMLAHVVAGLDHDAEGGYASGDFLGSLFMRLELFNHWKGQFFTPFEVCSVMARLLYTPEEIRESVRARGYVELHEPAVGAGAMVIAFGAAMRRLGLNPQRQLRVVAADVDPTAAYMCFIQLALLHIPAVVQVGNTLTGVVEEELLTPAYHLTWPRDRKMAEAA